jgi:hypothetical protein
MSRLPLLLPLTLIALCSVAILSVRLGGDPRAESAPVGLVAAYGFSEGVGSTFADASGNGNGGTISGASWSVQGRFGGALAFDGSDDIATVPDSASLDLTTGMTLQAWVNPITMTSWRTVLVKETTGSLVYGLYANSSSSRPVGEVRTSTLRLAYGLTQIPLNSWTHLAATYDGANLRFYVNGTLVRTTSASGNITVSGSPLRIGATTVWGEHFRGLIDEVRIYNRALSLSEIQTDMNTSVDEQAGPTATPTNTVPPTATPTPTNTVPATAAVTPTNTPTFTATATNTFTPTPSPTPTSVATPTNTPTGAALTGAWGAVQPRPHYTIHSSLTYTGEVLSWEANAPPTSFAQAWNIANNTYTAVTANSGLFCAGHSQLTDGRIFVAGGHAGTEIGIKHGNIYNPATRTWTRTADMAYARWYPSATTLPDGRVVVLSGNIVPGAWADTPEIYNPATNTWSPINVNTADMHEGGYPLSHLLPDGRIFSIGPSSATARILDVEAETWINPGRLPFFNGTIAQYRPGKFLYSGGGSPWLATTNGRTAVLDFTTSTPSYREIAPMAFGRHQHNLIVLPDGKVFAIGGASTVDVESGVGPKAAEMWDPATETWTTMASMQFSRNYHSTALLLPDGRVLASGGDWSNAENAEIYSPPYLFKGARPVITSAPSSASYSQTVTVATSDAADIASVVLIPPATVTHTLNDQKYVPLSFTRGSGQLSVTMPGNDNVAPPGYYMMFIVDSDGVPSVSSMVRLAGGTTDTTPPSVTVTNPANGATVSGTINLTANASDNIGVSGVQFAVDGVDVGAEDTVAPYAIPWDSTTVANGARTISARARDGAGNIATSSVTVTVDNAGGGPVGLVAAYSFNAGSGTTLADGSGNGNNGAISGASWSASGVYGGALSFDGVNDIVNVADSASIDLTTGMTLEAWVYPLELTSWRTILAKETTGGIVYALFGNSSFDRPVGEARTSILYDVAGTAKLPINTWSHLATTYDGANLRFYVNGTLVATRAATGDIATSSGALRIGATTVWGEYFRGLIDEVRIYNRALSASEVQADLGTPLP